ncbi:MAG: PIG-L family deacetylase [Acidobacteria bacterium]|nr:PIG-L family deacetylase [Acidobacteriota bacterium]
MRVLAAMAHPDDAEFLCAGTLRLLAECGWELRSITLSGGDMGAPSGRREEVRVTRTEEARRAAETIGGSYRWAGLSDLAIYYCPEQLEKVTDALREFAPDIVITHSPDCYMIDHEETAKLVRMACFGACIPLFPSAEPPTRNGVPALYYADAFEGKDKYGNPVVASFWIDVTSTFDVRQRALACHASQREWLRAQHAIDDYLATNESFAREHGSRCGVQYAEGFRQHLGHGYPQHNLLREALTDFALDPSRPLPGDVR